jgi:poly-gamma-glutamate capsule biosynthesis protein CapA/YwtB (metallophosphatase superfamily)
MPTFNFLILFLSSASFSTFAVYFLLFVVKITHNKKLAKSPTAKELNPALKTKTRAKKFSPHTRSSWTVLCLMTVLFFGCSNDSKDLRILFAGDLMLDRGVRNNIEENSPDYLFEDIKTIFKSSDVTIANFECVACNTSLKPIDKKFTFRANPEWLSSIYNNGITHVTLANNHSSDFGDEGVKQTAANLKYYGIASIGHNSDSNSTCLPTIIKKNGNSVAVFSSCFLKQNNNFICNENASALSERIKKFKKTNPSYLIFVSLHWGVEMELYPMSEQIAQAHLLIDAGADVIMGHHPHVVQTIEIYKERHIFYSIGNFIFDNNHAPANRGIFTEFSLANEKIKSIEIIPFNIVKSKPKLMNNEESENFINEISSVSQTLDLKKSDGNWKIL